MTLTQASSITRKAIIFFIIFCILGISGLVGLNIYKQYQLKNKPPKIEPPEMKFGALPAPIFPTSQISSSNFSYSLDTATGGMPETPRLIKVYFIPQSGISLLAPEKAKQLAESFGFSIGPQVLPEGSYQFTDNSGGSLIIDLETSNFRFQKNATPSAEAKELPDQNQLVSLLKNYLSSKNLLPEELKNGKNNVVYNNTNAQNSQSAVISLRSADFDKLPIVNPDLQNGLIKATAMRTLDENNKFNKLDYIYWTIDNTTSSTYPLKNPNEAFDDLRSGKGYVALEPQKTQVSISSVYLAYFESENYSPYLLPVFIFEGPQFAAFVSAINSSAK